MPLAVLVAGELVSGRRQQPPVPSVALNPIRTRWMEHLGRRPPCRRTMFCRTSCDAHDQRKRIIWRQAIRLSRRPGKCMCVGLRPSSRSRRDLGSVLRRLSIRCATRLPGPTITNGIFMRMAGQLLHGERRGADSAGQAGRRPRKLRQPPDQEIRMMYERA